MDTNDLIPQPAMDETALLKSRLQETEETLQAIRQYMVDAFVIHRSDGPQVVTLTGSETPYRLIVESMNEGVVTLIPDGTILYCNPYFGKMVMAEEEEIVGLQFRNFILPEDLSSFDQILGAAGQNADRGEFCLVTTDGTCVPVQLSIYPLARDGMNGFAIIATDITLRIQAEEKIRALTAQLTVVEQEERHRISQILHDDLQQRLFAVRAHLSTLKEEPETQGAPADLQRTLDQILKSLTEAITITRSLSINIDPIVLQGEGLAESLQWLASRMNEQYGLQVVLNSAQDIHGLDDQRRVVLFQAIRELLFNIVKHAGTLHASIQLTQNNGLCRITISDNGNGFDVTETLRDPHSAHGLRVVRDRLGLMGASMEIQSKPGDGTRILIEIPLGGFTTERQR